MLTIPRSLFKSYAKDLSFPIFTINSAPDALHFTGSWSRHNVMILDTPESVPIRTRIHQESFISPLSSMDSGLEAFSRNPTHGSFSALTFQSTDLPIM